MKSSSAPVLPDWWFVIFTIPVWKNDKQETVGLTKFQSEAGGEPIGTVVVVIKSETAVIYPAFETVTKHIYRRYLLC